MIQSIFQKELELLNKGYNVIVGVDEVGRGPLAGPVVAVAVTYKFFDVIANFQPISSNKDSSNVLFENLNLIRDSKKLSMKQREKIFNFILDNFYVGIGLCNHETIDRINILEASFLAMKKAITDLFRKSDFQFFLKKIENLKPIFLLDGNNTISNFSGEQEAVVNGDKLIKSISAASIVAKVTRDRIMLEMHKKYPQYNFNKHKGYGTKLHLDALQKYGYSEIHRQSFNPIKNLLAKKRKE